MTAVVERLLARHAACLEQVELGRLPEAGRMAGRALAAARRAGAVEVAAKFHLTLAWVELDRGRPAGSTRHLDAALPGLTGNDLARAHCLRGLHLCQHAAPRAAITRLTAAIRDLRRYGDQRWLANALVGRGIARAYALRLAAADADFSTARTVLLAIGEPDRAAMCLHNRGFVAMVAGDLPTALRHYEHAAREGLAAVRRPEALIDRAEALFAAGLVREAREVLAPAIALLDRCDRGSRIPDAVLLAARCALADNDFPAARTTADRAARTFRAQRRNPWPSNAVSLRARWAMGERPRAGRAAAECDRAGKPEDAAELRLAAGLPVQRRGGTARLRALAWLDTARRAPDRRRAVAACRAGLALVDPRTWPGAELRSIALGHALARGDARAVLRWSRIDAPAAAPVTGPLAERLRLARGQGDHDLVVHLEREIRRLSLAAPRPVPRAPVAPDGALLSFTVHNGQLIAVSVVDGRFRLHRLDPVDHHVRALRLAVETGHEDAVRASAEALDALLPPTGDGPVTIAGSPPGLPWAALPSYRGRPVSLGATPPYPDPPRAGAWIAGPNLAHADREVGALHRLHGGTVLTGRSATVEAALRAMDGVDVAHLAAHGHLRGDQPLFSSLELADGPLHGHDLDRLARPPRVVVLSACDSGLAPAFLRRGTGAVIASTLAVPDDRAPALMAAFHTALRAGLGPAAALAQAQVRHGDRRFNCFGPG
ncbi:CHAT domain-containing protein [Umezawaea sp. Da 62-37]|uniref:CHAT domain-containing protein n=1 Tax=Umezawaea sp. Da 62-37 TaxID=3075927 RepID=UPI0028F6DCB0|nr:CHAT domain-containing protein [Umezawaea sp. Da 62-37]WNV91103.1 CHAT domain-containing protein [Umezawaea sp. Da 62-37]